MDNMDRSRVDRRRSEDILNTSDKVNKDLINPDFLHTKFTHPQLLHLSVISMEKIF